jgi:uncharacterized membrane protein
MKTIDPELDRKNIRAAYERLHNEGVDALSAAIEQVKALKLRTKRKPFRTSSHRWRGCFWLGARSKV